MSGRFQDGEERRDDIPGQTEQSTRPLLYTAQRRYVDCWELNISGDTTVPGQAPSGCGGLKADCDLAGQGLRRQGEGMMAGRGSSPLAQLLDPRVPETMGDLQGKSWAEAGGSL